MNLVSFRVQVEATIPKSITSATTIYRNGNRYRQCLSLLGLDNIAGPSNRGKSYKEELLEMNEELCKNFEKLRKISEDLCKISEKMREISENQHKQSKALDALSEIFCKQRKMVDDLKYEIMGVRTAFAPATLNALMETAVAYSVDGVKEDYTAMSNKAIQATLFVATVLTMFVKGRSFNLSNLPELDETIKKALEEAVTFVKTIPLLYIKEHWPADDRNMVSHQSDFIGIFHDLPPKSSRSTASFSKDDIVQFMDDFEKIEKFSTWEDALSELYRLLHSNNSPEENGSLEKDIVRKVIKMIKSSMKMGK